jgi:hypothetical protein
VAQGSVVLAPKGGVRITNYDELQQFCEMVFTSGMAPSSFRTAMQIGVAVQYGMELGLGPMASLQTIAVINGKPCAWGDGMLALCQAHPAWDGMEELQDVESQTATCTVWREGKAYTSSFSIEEARAAALLGKDPWKKYPKRMLQMRARSWSLRAAFADALMGLSSAEETRDLPPRDAEVIGDPRPTDDIDALVETEDERDDVVLGATGEQILFD